MQQIPVQTPQLTPLQTQQPILEQPILVLLILQGPQLRLQGYWEEPYCQGRAKEQVVEHYSVWVGGDPQWNNSNKMDQVRTPDSQRLLLLILVLTQRIVRNRLLRITRTTQRTPLE